VRYGFDCAFDRIEIGLPERLAPKAGADRFRIQELLALSVSGRAISAEAFADVAKLLRGYERIEAVSAECGAEETASHHLRGVRESDWKRMTARRRGRQSRSARGGFTTTISVAATGRVEIEG